MAWNWSADKLLEMSRQHKDFILCGRASNQMVLRDYFDQVFLLSVEAAIHDRRLRTRAQEYGKHPRQREAIIADEPLLKAQVMKLGATAIDASQPIEHLLYFGHSKFPFRVKNSPISWRLQPAHIYRWDFHHCQQRAHQTPS